MWHKWYPKLPGHYSAPLSSKFFSAISFKVSLTCLPSRRHFHSLDSCHSPTLCQLWPMKPALAMTTAPKKASKAQCWTMLRITGLRFTVVLPAHGGKSMACNIWHRKSCKWISSTHPEPARFTTFNYVKSHILTNIYGCFQKWGYPQIIHFNRVFHYKPSILGYPYFWKHPYIIYPNSQSPHM